MVMHVYSMSVTANLTHLDDGRAENVTCKWKTVHSAAQATPGRTHRRLVGLGTGTKARPHLQVPRTSLKGDSRLELPKSCLPLRTKP